jgi:hypothetical protein
MFKTFILTFLSIFIISSCSIKNPFAKKNELIYLDCPKSLILLAGSKKIQDNVIIGINKNYKIDCFYYSNEPKMVIFEINYIIDTNNVLPDSDILLFDFWVFLTNKKENIKVNEQMFQKVIDFGSIEDDSEDIKFSFSDQIIIDKQKYEDGLKIFISLN